MKVRLALTVLSALVLGIVGGGGVAAAVGAPTPMAPASGGQVLVPFTISWSAGSDPSGIVAYNWQVSPSSAFATVILQNSTSGATQDSVGGLAHWAHFWPVQAANSPVLPGAVSQPPELTVTR